MNVYPPLITGFPSWIPASENYDECLVSLIFDLLGPLQRITYCAEKLEGSCLPLDQQKYLLQMDLNVKRCVLVINTLNEVLDLNLDLNVMMNLNFKANFP